MGKQKFMTFDRDHVELSREVKALVHKPSLVLQNGKIQRDRSQWPSTKTDGPRDAVQQ